MAQADEAKVAALESIFGGQDITASVIRTVLSSNDNKFDEAVDSLLNMSTSDDSKPQQSPKPARAEETEEALHDRREKEKLKTLENMFGGDLTQSVICTVLESNKGELVDAVDTLLNMTSKDINPNYTDVSQRDIERARQEEELKNYEEFRRLQISLQEEEARAVKEEQLKRAEDLRKSTEAAAAEERRRKELVQEQERRLKEFEAQKKAQADAVAREQARRQEAEQRMAEDARRQAEHRREAELEEAQEKLRRAWEEKLKLLNAEEEKVRKLQEVQQAEEEARRRELLAREQALTTQEQQIQKARQMEETRLAERKAMLEREEAAKAESRRLEIQQREKMEQQLRAEAEAKLFAQRLEQEERARLRRVEEERKEQEHKQRLEEERQELQKERAKFEAARLAEEERRMREEEEKLRLKFQLEEEEREERRAEEDALIRKLNEERRLKEEEERQELLRVEQEMEAKRLQEEMQRNQALKEEAEKQQAAFEEERRKKSVFDQIAASAVFIPPKAEATADQIAILASVIGDTVLADWDLPEGNASTTNWLGLYPIRALPNTNKYVQFVYTNGAHTGQHVFRGVTPGHYEVRFFATRSYEHTARSATMRVGPTPTLSAQLQGDQLLVYYTLDPMSATPTREWLGIYEKTQRRNKKYLSSAYGNAEGNVMIKAPRTPGVYEVRMFATGSVYNEQAKCEFVVEDNDCINIDASSAMAGTIVNASWVIRTLEPSSGDWIGLYKADEANNGNYISSTYTTGASVGSVAITAPKEAGVYELRLFARAKGRYATFRTSIPLTVV